jgi:hypothetical protein
MARLLRRELPYLAFLDLAFPGLKSETWGTRLVVGWRGCCWELPYLAFLDLAFPGLKSETWGTRPDPGVARLLHWGPPYLAFLDLAFPGLKVETWGTRFRSE